MSRRHRAALILAAALASVTVTGCGVPQDETTRVIDPARVPYDLLGSGAGTGSGPMPSPTASGQAVVAPQVFFLDAEQQPVGLRQEPDGIGVTSVVSDLLVRLSAGPTDEERAEGLSSALGPGVRLKLIDVRDQVARVAVVPSEPLPPADRIPLAVGQIVFTVTSVDGVDRVQLVRRSRTIEVPLPGGARTSEPVGASDYLRLFTDPAGAATAAP